MGEIGGLGTGARTDNQRNVVILLMRAEPCDLVNNRRQHRLRRQLPASFQPFHQTLFAELFLGGIARLGDSIGVEHERVSTRELDFAD